MKYNNIIKGYFQERPNRFIAECLLEDNRKIIAHVKNTGRCRELLISGCEIYLEDFSGDKGSKRKTDYDLIAVNKNGRLINMDSQVPNKVVMEALKKGINLLGNKKPLLYIKGEQKYKNSRFDIYAESEDEKFFIEVKGVTLEENNIALFPDAPTQRGIKHIMELISAKNEGYNCHIIFVIQMKGIDYFTPNYKTHKEFGEALQLAKSKGINISAWDCQVSENSIILNERVEYVE